MWKFRTMREDSDSISQIKLTGADDSRVTRAGYWLRQTKINELPQLLNVLRGEMTLVGPRPEDPEFSDNWTAEERKELLSVLPGMTSPASLLFRKEEEMLEGAQLLETYFGSIQPDKVRLDLLYVRNHSFWIDLNVLFWTAILLLPRLRASEPIENQLFAGSVYRFGQWFINWGTIDFAIVYLSFGVAGVILRSFGPFDVGLGNYAYFSLGFAVVFSLVSTIFGMHRIHWSKASVLAFFELSITSLVATLVALGINSAYQFLPNSVVIFASLLAYLGFFVSRFRNQLWAGVSNSLPAFSRPMAGIGERVLIVGCGDAGQLAAWMLKNSRAGQRYTLRGYIDDDMFRANTRIRDVKVVGTSAELQKIVEEEDIGILLFAIHNIEESEQERLLQICHSSKARTILMPNLLANLEDATNGHDQGDKSMQGVARQTFFNIIEGLLSEAKAKSVDGDMEKFRELLLDIESLLATAAIDELSELPSRNTPRERS